MATFPERLKMLRERARLTQEQLADKLGISVGGVGNWESGLNMPTRVRMRKLALELGTTELFLSGESDIDSFTYAEEGPEYKASLQFSRMTPEELQFIFESRQKELADQKTGPERKRELLGIIAEVAGEMQKRIPAVSSEESAVAGAQKIFEAAKGVVSKPGQPAPANQPSDSGHQGSKSSPPGGRPSKKHS